ncbi:GGDEF domain-containing protein [Dokdonella sp. MW10]|uniref:GGDEF domain-containing protein n=1 Tax=Dokdonella sp. MW10 TaxID=2992926 RepID=UPI003F7DCEAC
MPPSEPARHRAAARDDDLLLQELRETRERARLGGFFYPIACALTFVVTTDAFSWQAFAMTSVFVLLAAARVAVKLPPAPTPREVRALLQRIWAIVLVTTLAWGGFSAWVYLYLPEPAPLVAVLFSGAFGMALCHTLCMRRLPSAVTIGFVMLPSMALLWHSDGAGIAIMWGIYMVYMLLVLKRSYGEYRTRLELEQSLREQRDMFERQSRIDGLTGITNRRGFNDALAAAIERARRGAGVASLLILDIDHFKRINDSLGHLAGDACLVALAQRLREHFEATGDVVARLGGEEFGVVLSADEDIACKRAEHFRRDLEREPLAFEGRADIVTVSIGCGAFDASRHADDDALYHDVDAALYRAKLGGRNRTGRVEAGHPRAREVLEDEAGVTL